MSTDRQRYGNRVWLVDTPAGPALQKVYRRRTGRLKSAGTALFSGLLGGKTSRLPAGRRRAEREALALWRESGLDVPRDLTDEVEGFAADDLVLMEFIPGENLLELLTPGRLTEEERTHLLRTFAADWGRRHLLAIERGEPRFVCEHGTFEHVIRSGERLVNIDLECTYRKGDLKRLIAKEVLSFLRSLRKRTDGAAFASAVRAIVEGYPDLALLRWAAAEYARSESPWRRLLWRMDRALRERKGGRSRAKYSVVDRLTRELDQAASEALARG